jgi:sensor histidine kinase regulating citrate/malate metabolism
VVVLFDGIAGREGVRMRRAGSGWSVATLTFAIAVALALSFAAVTSVYLVVDARADARHDAVTATSAVSATLADWPVVREALASDDATSILQPVVDRVSNDTHVDFVTIMRPDGTRVTHPLEGKVGEAYLGTIPTVPEPLSEEYVGSLGASVRTIVPVLDGDRVVGWVSSGITIRSIDAGLGQRLAVVAGVAVGILLIGLAGALYARRWMREIAGDLPASTLRDAVSSSESLRTLTSAMRAQAHEHGNRIHAAVGLLELGRTDDAIELLTETSARQQSLADVVALGSRFDPAVQALLLGKAADAAERGIEWSLEISPEAPRSRLRPVDAVSVCGNLIDNALEAAAAGPESRWVEVSIEAGEGNQLVVAVADSGPGLPPGLEERVFEEGVSTKPAGAAGRGVGLALVRSIVTAAGGSVDVTANPTVFTVTIPGRDAAPGDQEDGQ